MKKKIFLVSYGGGHSRLLIPVIHKLQGMNHYEIEVLGLTASAADYLAADIPFYGMVKLMESFGDDHILQMGRALLSDVSHSAVSLDESIAYLGLSYRELVEVNGESRASNLYKEYGRQAFLPISLMKRWLQKIKPDLVIATSSPRMERATLEAASNLGIPSICLVDLFCIDEYRWVAQKNFASKVCVMAEPVKNFLISKGRPRNDIEVTGNPALQFLPHNHTEEKKRLIRDCEGWGADFVVLWAVCDEPKINPYTGQPAFLDLNASLLALFGELLKKNVRWRLMVRLHPSMSMNLESLPERMERDHRRYPLPSLLSSVDCVVTSGSTVGLEAAILGVPVISLKMSNVYTGAPYDQYGYALGVNQLADLEKALKMIEGAQWVPDKADVPPADAVNRIMNVISSIMS